MYGQYLPRLISFFFGNQLFAKTILLAKMFQLPCWSSFYFISTPSMASPLYRGPRFGRHTFLNFSSRRVHLCVRNALYFVAGRRLHILVPVPVPFPVPPAMLLLNMHKFPFCTGLLHLHLLFICRWKY